MNLEGKLRMLWRPGHQVINDVVVHFDRQQRDTHTMSFYRDFERQYACSPASHSNWRASKLPGEENGFFLVPPPSFYGPFVPFWGLKREE
jgi:hypothetical protein